MTDVLFRFRAPEGTPAVDLRGDMTHWNDPGDMTPAGDGWWQLQRPLDPGVYEYKFRLSDRQWELDPANPRTRASAGERNSLLVVGGTSEPILHAPVAPYLYVEDDGRICVRAGLRRGAASHLAIAWNEGAGFRHQAMTPVADEGEHQLYEVRLPGSAASLDYMFVLGDTPRTSEGFSVRVDQLAGHAPAWWREAVVYSIFVDRFRRGGHDGSWTDPQRWDREFQAGGDLDGVCEALPYLRDLGVTALHLTPICEAASPHRYDCIDPRRVAPDLGGRRAFDRVIERAHDLDLRVLVDVTVTHVDRDFFAFRDVRERGDQSPYWDWFYVHSWPFAEGQRPGYRHYQKGQWREPMLRLDNDEVAEYIAGTFAQWVRWGADGVRVDAAADVPLPLLRRIGDAVADANPDAVVFGEVVPANTHRFTGAGLHSATDFAFQGALRDWLCGTSGARQLEFVRRQRQLDSGGPGWRSLLFTSTHDHLLLASQTAHPALARLGQLSVLLRAGVPMLYYGDEIGLRSDVRDCAFEDAWPDRQCMTWDDEPGHSDCREFVRAVLALRKQHPALHRGTEHTSPFAAASPHIFGFRRIAGSAVFDVVMNRDTQPAQIPVGAEPAFVVLGSDGAHIAGDSLHLDPFGWAVIDRSQRVDAQLVDRNAELCRQARAQRLTECPAYPSRLYLTITEACNLRCAHCITDAPRLTREGRARSVQPWLVDALAPALAAADYFGFVHGGESLVSPMLGRMVAAIERAHAGQSGRYDIHLASNGMLLRRERILPLLDRGLSSIMVSLDGASAAVNDRIRIGGRLQRIVANLRDLVRLRDANGYDLRIGISSVLGKTNIHEADSLAALAVDIGVDWLKLEETYPVNGFAIEDRLLVSDERMAAALANAAERLANTGVTLVDHVNPPSGCVCGEASDALRSFRRADDYANRFEYCACRAPWEQACIDPDGGVHQVDYGYPSLGSVLDTPMLELWNSATAQDIRAAALR